MKTFVATVRAEVVKPLDTSWDLLGRQLRALQRPLHRVLNHAITEIEMMHAGKLLGFDGSNEQTLSYQQVRDYWRLEREGAADRVARGKPYTGDEDIATIAPAGSAILGSASSVYTRWKLFDKTRWKGESSLPTFKGCQPIAIASSSKAIRLTLEDGSFVLDVRMIRGEPHTRLAIRPYSGSGFAELRRIVIDPKMLGDCKFVYEPPRGEKHGKWQVLLAVKRPERKAIGDNTMAIHRGVRTFLTAAVMGDDRRDALTMVVADGGDVAAHKAAYSARRRSLGRHQRERGDGARGHGKVRRFEAITRLENIEANWNKTRCQQIAARVVRLAEQRGVSRIIVENWGNPAKDGAPELGEHMERIVRQFPLAQLKEAIGWAAKNVGIAIDEVPTTDYSRRCPNCGHTHDVMQFPKFHCASCELERSVDFTFPWNMLVDYAAADGRDLVQAHNRTLRRVRERIVGK